MSFQRGIMGVWLLCLMALARSNPISDQDEVVTEVATEVDTAVATEVATEISTEIPRENNPVYNVWEYAYVHDGPVITRSAASHDSVEQPSRGNQCLWAIVSCCNAETNYERDNCFDALGCPGAWFQNLCSQEYIDVANSQVYNIFSGGLSSGLGKK